MFQQPDLSVISPLQVMHWFLEQTQMSPVIDLINESLDITGRKGSPNDPRVSTTSE